MVSTFLTNVICDFRKVVKKVDKYRKMSKNCYV